MAYSKLVLIFLFLSLSSFADDKNFERENKQAMMNFGFGIAQALSGTGVQENIKNYTSQQDPRLKLTSYVERTSGCFIKRVLKSNNTNMLVGLNVFKKQIELPFGGTLEELTKADVVSNLGRSNENKNGELIYYVPSYSGSDTLIFHFKSDKLDSIEWRWETE